MSLELIAVPSDMRLYRVCVYSLGVNYKRINRKATRQRTRERQTKIAIINEIPFSNGRCYIITPRKFRNRTL